MANRRYNISIPEPVHDMFIQEANKLYGKEHNLSRFLTDAGLFYLGMLKESKAGKERGKENDRGKKTKDH